MFDDLRNSINNVKNNLKSERRIKREIGDSMDRIAREKIAAEAKANAPVDRHSEPGDNRRSGRLKDSIRASDGEWRSSPKGDRYAVSVGSTLDYAEAIERGRAGDEIWANDEDYLHFYWKNAPYGYVDQNGSKWYKGQVVDWPGIEKQEFLLDAVNDPEVQRAIEDEVADDFETAIRFG